MKLSEAIIFISENYIDVYRFSSSEFVKVMQEKTGGFVNDDLADRMFQDYVKAFWRLTDERKITGQDASIDYWYRRVMRDPSNIRLWVDLIDRHR